MKKIAFALFLYSSIMSLDAANPMKEFFIEQPWRFVEYELIIKPDKELASWATFGKKMIPTLGIAGATGYLCAKGSQEVPVVWNNLYTRSLATSVGTPLATIIAAMMSRSLIKNYLTTSAEYKAFLTFIREWNENKHLAPASFVKPCDQLYRLYQVEGESETFKAYVFEAMSLIQKQIYQQFPETYGHRLSTFDAPAHSYSFYHTIITCDIGHLLEVIAKIVSGFTHKD